MRRFLPYILLSAIVTLTLVSATLFVNRLIVDAQNSQITSETETYAKSFAARLESRVLVRLGVVKLLQKNWENGHIRNLDDFRQDAESVHDLFGDLQALNWVSPAGVIELVTPLEGNEAAVGLDVGKIPMRARSMAEAVRTGEVIFSPPLSLVQGGTGFVAYLPLRRGQTPTGFINIVFRSDPMIRSAMEQSLDGSYNIWITDDGIPMFGGDLPKGETPHLVETDVNVGGRSWSVMSAPTPEKIAQAATGSDEVVLVSGLLLSLVTGILIGFAVSRQQSLRASEERFAFAMRGANDGLWDWDMKTGGISFSPRWFEMLGYAPDELPSSHDTFLSLLHPDEKQSVAAHPKEITLQSEDVTESEFRMRHKDGTWVNVLSRAFLVRKNDEVVRIVGTHVDITERRKNEEALRYAQEILREGLETLPVGFAYYDADGRLLVFNQNYQKLLSRKALHLEAGRTIEEIMLDTHAFAGRRMAANGGLQSKTTIDWVYQRSDQLWIKAVERPSSSGGFIHVIEDITDARVHQERLQQTHRMEAIGQLTGGIAHDFNNLLAVIMGNAELLDELSGEPSDLTSAIIHATVRGAELTQRLLAFARRQPLNPEPVDLSRLIPGMYDMLNRTLGETIPIEIISPDNLWEALADPGQIENAILNLALNARDAMPAGGALTIETANVSVADSEDVAGEKIAAGDYVALSVRDQGTGMSKAVRNSAFEPFFTTKGVGKGSGLGLSMVYGFAQQSGGQAKISSKEGQGTTVTLLLPRAKPPTENQTPSAPPALLKGQGETILVVEDDESVRKLIVTMLANLGYFALYAEDAAAARNIVETAPDIKLLLIDVVLPGGTSGPEIAAELRMHRPELKVVFMSGYPADEIDHGSIRNLGSPLLNKPFSKQVLGRALRDAW